MRALSRPAVALLACGSVLGACDWPGPEPAERGTPRPGAAERSSPRAGAERSSERPGVAEGSAPRPGAAERSSPPPGAAARIQWRRSVALGSPSAGRLERGVRLPAEGAHFFSWDPVQRRKPNRAWRRHGTDRLVRLVLRTAREYRLANPGAPRMAVGDLSRPHGGDFGPQYGYIGHASHQNGLDVDVYYPRADGRERAPRDASEIDRELSQDLVDRFVAAGAVAVFVGPNTGLQGPAGVVAALANHDNHLHVRIR